MFTGNFDRFFHTLFQGRLIIDNIHGPSAQHKRGPDEQGVAKFGGDLERFLIAACGSAERLLQFKFVDQPVEPFSVFGQVDAVGTGGDDRDTRIPECIGQVQGRL